jgi:SulP family sulfate permease
MIFAVSRAVSRQHAMVEDNDVLVIDLTDVSLLDVNVSLAIENAIKDQLDVNSTVFVVCTEEHAKDLIERLEIDQLLPEDHVMNDRTEALRRAVALIDTTEPPQPVPASAAA